MQEECMCGCNSFNISKKGHQFMLICERCKCQRVIITPGVGVSNYEVSVQFRDQDYGKKL